MTDPLTQRLRELAGQKWAMLCKHDDVLTNAADRITELEAVLSELWALRMMRMSCSVMTAQQSSEYAARSDAAWVAVQRVLEGK